ncbi:ROK family protein [Marinilactibacillus kalidii]|uniref:ROK family protein n=1 Tax=Marinilactibacillus kalidii TaxID=2820274 RepID=UPI001ABDB956|nr:ROK family protein [Marinilactibacillus kalidii]
MNKYLVYDVGGSAIKYAIMSEEKIFSKGKVATPKEDLTTFINKMEEIYLKYEQAISGIAISMPGVINAETGYAVHGGSLEFIRQMNLRDKLAKKLKHPIVIENDGKSAALGEVWKGNLQGIENGIALILGTGIGGGIIANGQLLKGHHFAAGEFSTIRTDGQKPLAYETMLANTGSSVKLVERTATLLGKEAEHFTGVDLFKEIKSGNQEVEKLFFEYCDTIAAQIMNLQTILDPEMIVIGGGMSEEPLFVEGIQKAVNDLFSEDVMTEINGFKAEITPSTLGNEANLYGALYQYLLITKENPISDKDN